MKKLLLAISLIALLQLMCTDLNSQNYIRIDASFYSEVLDTIKKVDVYLPIDYYEHPEQQYATIYYLHGAGGDQNEGNTDASWYYNLHAQDTTISSPPAIFVCPDGSCEPYLGSCWMNSELYGSYEDYFIQDVIEFIESNFRAYQHKNFRSLVGWSMGGYGSARFSVNNPDMFRACVPCIGFLSMPDTLLNAWKDLYYEDNGSYIPTVNNMTNTQLLLTMSGGLSPNLNNPPCYVDFPFDTLGNMLDTVLNRWRQNDLSRKVKDLPDEHELSWFMICGTQDYMITHPTYHVFTDSLDFYGIGYDFNYFEGGHVFDPESWMMAIHWLDSIINYSYQTLGIETVNQPLGQLRLYPNPASNQIVIVNDWHAATEIQIEIFDFLGQKMDGFMVFPPARKEIPIDISNYPAGTYFCKLTNGDKVFATKFIKY